MLMIEIEAEDTEKSPTDTHPETSPDESLLGEIRRITLLLVKKTITTITKNRPKSKALPAVNWVEIARKSNTKM